MPSKTTKSSLLMTAATLAKLSKKLSERDLELVELAQKGANDAHLLLVDKINKIEDKIDKKLTEMEAKFIKDTDIFKKITFEGVKGDKGANGDKGEKGDPGRDGQDGKDGLNGKDGKDGLNGRDGKDGNNADESKIIETVKSQIKIPEVREIENDLPKLGAPIRDALELLQGEERLEMSAVKGLEDKLKEVETASKKGGNSVGGLINTVRYYDLSSQLNGTLKEFYVPAHRVAVQLIGTEFPIVYRPSTDFTTANHTLTLTSEVSAPAQGQSLILLYIK